MKKALLLAAFLTALNGGAAFKKTFDSKPLMVERTASKTKQATSPLLPGYSQKEAENLLKKILKKFNEGTCISVGLCVALEYVMHPKGKWPSLDTPMDINKFKRELVAFSMYLGNNTSLRSKELIKVKAPKDLENSVRNVVAYAFTITFIKAFMGSLNLNNPSNLTYETMAAFASLMPSLFYKPFGKDKEKAFSYVMNLYRIALRHLRPFFERIGLEVSISKGQFFQDPIPILQVEVKDENAYKRFVNSLPH